MSRNTIRQAAVVAAIAIAAALAVTWWRRASVDATLMAAVRRGPLTVTLTTNGSLRPSQSFTYRSPVAGRDVEILDLALEGRHVKAGDLIVRLDRTDVDRELDRAREEATQAQSDLEVAESEWEEAAATVRAVNEGEGALTVEEGRTRLQLSERKATRLREEYAQLKPLLDRGFLTREELARTGDELDSAEEELGLARRRMSVLEGLTHPQETRRAEMQLAQKQSQRKRAAARVQETTTRIRLLHELGAACSIYASGPGIVVYEAYLGANPRRKIRVGDRVTTSQGIVTISEISRMMLDGTVSEAQVHRIAPGQKAAVRVEAFPGARLEGTVLGVGTLAGAAAFRSLDDKRFDLVIELTPSAIDLRPEMSARADVIVGTRESVLLLPVTAVFERAGGYVAYVPAGAGVEARRLELGESNDEFVEVKGGLQEGERVYLVPPPTALPPSSATPPGARLQDDAGTGR